MSVSDDNIFMNLQNGKRYAHTASRDYNVTMATIQIDNKKTLSCACSEINSERNSRASKKEPYESKDSSIVIIEHNLKEFILCILDSDKNKQSRINLRVHAGEQVAFRVVGRHPVELVGICV